MSPQPLFQIVQRMTLPPDTEEVDPRASSSAHAWREAALRAFLAEDSGPGNGDVTHVVRQEAMDYWTSQGPVDEKQKEAEECLLAWAQLDPAVSLPVFISDVFLIC